MGVLLQAILLAILALSPVWGQQAERTQDEDDDAEELAALFRVAPESPIRFLNRSRAPIAIEKVSVRVLKSDQVKLKSVCACGGAYIVLPMGILVNKSEKRTRSVTLRFTDEPNGVDTTMRVGAIAPGSLHILNEGRGGLLSIDASPVAMEVSVFEVVFDDGLVWEAEPSIKQESVESEPVIVRMPGPRYTEDAIKNKIEGVVRMKLLVGKDGSVRAVRIIKGLTDGLSEQAIQAAYNALFKPAMRGNSSVEYSVLCELDFTIPANRRQQ
jgi:TonB family protein